MASHTDRICSQWDWPKEEKKFKKNIYGSRNSHIMSQHPLSPSVSDADGQMKVAEIATRPLVQDLLNHDVSFCLGLWKWESFIIRHKHSYTRWHVQSPKWCALLVEQCVKIFLSCAWVDPRTLFYRTATSWTREAWRSLCGKGRRQTKQRDRQPCLELWCVGHPVTSRIYMIDIT